MAIEIKELIVRAVIDSQSENQNREKTVQADSQDASLLPYLESLMKNMDQKNER